MLGHVECASGSLGCTEASRGAHWPSNHLLDHAWHGIITMAHPPSLALPRPVLSGEGSSSSSPHIQPSSTLRSDSSCRTYSSAEDASPTAPTYNLNTRSEAIPVAFEMQIVSLDSYMARPIPNVDIGYSSFMGEALRELPVIRVFGSTPAGQSVCAHIHNVRRANSAASQT